MFNFTDNAHNSSGPAVEDEIVRDTGRALGQVMAAARSWIHNHRGRRGAEGVPKLTRKERRDLAESIRVQVGEQQIAAAWFTKRVNDYHAEVVAAGLRSQQPGFTEQDAALDRERLAGIRYSIESTLHEGQALPLERRGQVALALSEADRNPSQPYGAIFKNMDAEAERTARAVAVQSEGWVAARREHNARLVAEQRAKAAQRAEARRELRPPRGYDELNDRQRNAVQRLRSAHLGVNRSGNALDPEVAEKARASTAEAAFAAGLTRREIAHEIDYMAEHTGYTATYGVPGSVQVRNHYGFREEAIAETRRELARDQRLPRDGKVYVDIEARPDGLAIGDPERRGVMGPRYEAFRALTRWSRDRQPGYVVAEPHEVAVARIDPATGEVLASEVSTLGSEAAALDYAHASVDSADADTARMRVEITDPNFPGNPRFESYGMPKSLTTALADQRVTARERLLGENDLERQDLEQAHRDLRQRHGLSIEHNADLTERNARLTQQLTAMIAERDQALATAKTLRQERDEAVSKVIETTHPSQRYGSAERQATQARRTAQPVNAFSVSESVNAFAAAEREDGIER
ncbi:hypothetical protein ACIO52_04570 [Nocardia sp. NPDC087230]|uniref:hypothetical protein n=1 Tax=Nocardia sp. NPDC087230 TaxID=3364331 RepID=UPI00380D902A